ncbi:MAG TPA: acyl-CoA dehydrogenase [Porticoccaceae bacterium]|nr:acyl-CoA dehydrogenase [Porticoccaceae bacterium]HCO60599.1 acyl-CoA dehydrogenase [Porticoccaceae bacterium]
MDFELSEDQRALQDLCYRLGSGFDDAYWNEIDQEKRRPTEFWELLIEQGLLGMTIPEEYGGSGLGLLDLCIASEALGDVGCADGTSPFVAGPVFGGYLIERGGTPAQKQEILPALVAGEMWAGAFTEPDSGSNVTNIKTFAERDGDHFVVHGQKVFISNLSVAKRIAVLCRTAKRDEKNRMAGITLLLGDLPDDRIEYRPFKKMGTNYMDTNALFFDGYRIPVENVVGEEGNAWRLLYKVLNPERLVIAAMNVGVGNYAIRKAVEYATDRSVWGVPLATHQGLQFPLAEARIQLECARLKVYQAAWLFDKGEDAGIPAVMAKHAAIHAALFAADRAIQTMGGAGYIADSGVERIYRNLRGGRMVPISDEMVLNTVAQHDLGMPRSY